MIEINNLTSFSIDERLFKKISKKILSEENKRESELSIAFIRKKIIKQLNKRYLEKDKATDVLSFPGDRFSSQSFGEKAKEKEFLGEIVICPQVVKENAVKFNFSFQRELFRVLVHGILHLLGYGHEKSVKEIRKMEERENYYFKKYFVNLE